MLSFLDFKLKNSYLSCTFSWKFALLLWTESDKHANIGPDSYSPFSVFNIKINRCIERQELCFIIFWHYYCRPNPTWVETDLYKKGINTHYANDDNCQENDFLDISGQNLKIYSLNFPGKFLCPLFFVQDFRTP